LAATRTKHSPADGGFRRYGLRRRSRVAPRPSTSRVLDDAALLDGAPHLEKRAGNGAAGVEHLADAPLRPPRRQSVAVGTLGIDALLLGFASIAAVAVSPFAGLPRPTVAWMLAFSLFVMALLAYFGHYKPRFTLHLLDDLRSVLGSTAVAAMGMAFVTALLTDHVNPAEEALRAWLFASTCLVGGRAALHLDEIRRRREGVAGAPTLVVGAGRVGHLVAKRLQERPEFGLRPVAFLDPEPLAVDNGAGLPILGAERDSDESLNETLASSVRELGVRHVIVTFYLSSHESQLELMRNCHEMALSVSVVPRLFEGVADETSLDRLGGIPLVTVRPSDPRGWQFALKYALDRVLAALAIVVTAPLMLFAAVGVAISMGRPVMYRQRRLGMDDREFEIRKFRTMKTEGLEAGEPELARTLPELMLRRDTAPGGVETGDRRTRFGRFLRRTSMDELPQLFNVLRGEMSLVGPRPERPEFALRFNDEVHRYLDRRRVKSGITGWAQVHGLRGKTSLSDRVEWDNYYIENWSLWLDLKVALMTLFVIFSHDAE
jgi:exopolysaccharide biosynthesis polyprenyl glycosylphosphotransferase